MRVARPLYALTASETLDLLKGNTVTVEQYAHSLLGRVKERDHIIKAWAYLDPESVLKQAKALDQIPEDRRGPLHGIAVGIKDVMNTKDMPTQFGSVLYEGHQPGFDSSAVAILRAAGALIFGKTTTTEFTVPNSGPGTTNPHDPKRTPGGSSCGSAAAVADFQVPISLGSQTGGSLIRPASFTGLFAMKPTHNAISTEGQKAFSPSFDTLGFMTRSMDDLRLLATVFGLKDDKSPEDVALERLSVALVKSPMWHRAGPGTVAAMKNAVAILEDSGVRVDEVSFPPEFGVEETIREMQRVVMGSEARVSFLGDYRIGKTKLDSKICDLVENSSGITHEQRIQALDGYANMRAIADGLAAKYSVIITPSAVDEAPLGLQDMGSAAFNTLWTGLHLPLINIPAFVGAHGMPIGISLVAGRFHDQYLIRLGTALSEPLMAVGGWQEALCSVRENQHVPEYAHDMTAQTSRVSVCSIL
ncbi:amidase signature domain-containing protein [Chaetomium fimeti]|uniref:Amidase signature domain-containing protein n=1 Tax=Chaetomium fimeti TaxID=1854472 RepID=A0AAE0HQG7_9PEZI|nr:amidase signature domain-containing protein [Chaetomium fimeti]